MAAKKKAAAAPLTWAKSVVSTEGLPIVVAEARVFAKRRGDEEDGPAGGGYVGVEKLGDDDIILLDTEGGGAADVGFNETDTIILLTTDAEDVPKLYAKLLKEIENEKHTEYLVGEIELAGDLVVEDGGEPGTNEPAFRLARTPGRYSVTEGHFETDGLEGRWCRITPVGRKKYKPRPVEVPRDPVQEEMEDISFEDAKHEAWALEAALRLVGLGRPDLALEICAKASPARRALATWTRIMALAAQNDAAAVKEATEIAEEWLRPADSAEAANQMLPRAQLLRAIDAAAAAGDVTAVRAKVLAAPEPDVFIAEGGGDFF